MTLYKGQADQTVINAAKTAYTYPTVDYTSFFEGLASVAKFITGKVGAANSRMSTISGFEEEVDKQFWSNNNSEFFGDLKQNMVDASNIMKFNPKWSQKYKDAERLWLGGQEVLNKIKKDEAVLEQWIKDVDRGLVDLSAYNNPALISLMADIKLGKTFDESVLFTEDGIKVVGPNGDYVFIDELPAIVKKSDGKVTKDFFLTEVSKSITAKNNGTWDDQSKYIVMENIKSHIDDVGLNNMGSAAFDFQYRTKDGEMSFSDYLLQTHPDMKPKWEQWLLDNPGQHDKDTLVAAKHMVALNIWDDGYLMKDEFLDFLEMSLDYQVGNTKTSSHNKTNNNNKSNTNDDSGDDLPNQFENVTNLDGTLYEGDLPNISAGDVVFSGKEHADLGDNSMYKMVRNDDGSGTLMFFDRKNNKWKPSENQTEPMMVELFPHLAYIGEINYDEPIISGGTITSSALTSLVGMWGNQGGATNLKSYLEDNNLIPDGYRVEVWGGTGNRSVLNVFKGDNKITYEEDQSIGGEGYDETDVINILEALGHKVSKKDIKTKTKTRPKTFNLSSRYPHSKSLIKGTTIDGSSVNWSDLYMHEGKWYYSTSGERPKKGDQTTKDLRYLNRFKDQKLLDILEKL